MEKTPYEVALKTWSSDLNGISLLSFCSPLWFPRLQGHLRCGCPGTLTVECAVKINDNGLLLSATTILTAGARRPAVHQLCRSSSAAWTANVNHSTCTLFRPERARAFLITLRTANHGLKLSPQIPIRKPFYLSLPVQLSHRLVPTPLL